MNTKRQLILGLTMMMAALITAIAQPTQQIPDKTFNPGDLSTVVGPPKVQIIEVKTASAPGTGFQVRVKWTAQVPNATKIEKFEISVSVRDTNNNTNTGNKTAVGTARELLIPVSITAKPVTFQANITTFFVPINQVKSELSSTILLDKGNGFSGNGSTGQTGPRPPGDVISKVALANGTDLKGFDVQWQLRPRTQDVTEKQTKITGTFTYKKSNQNVGTRSASVTVGVGTRQARLTVSSAPVSSLVDVRIEAAIKIEVFFNLLQRLVTTLNGNFPTN
jgi:hypothetical protein